YYNHNINFFPISWKEEDQVSNVKMFSQAINVLGMLLKYTLNSDKFIKSELREELRNEYDAKVSCESVSYNEK
ncbi:MAG: hypothetical protein ACLRY8_09585, partial [Clostridium butyricum]